MSEIPPIGEIWFRRDGFVLSGFCTSLAFACVFALAQPQVASSKDALERATEQKPFHTESMHLGQSVMTPPRFQTTLPQHTPFGREHPQAVSAATARMSPSRGSFRWAVEADYVGLHYSSLPLAWSRLSTCRSPAAQAPVSAYCPSEERPEVSAFHPLDNAEQSKLPLRGFGLVLFPSWEGGWLALPLGGSIIPPLEHLERPED